jgi:hypothetical protein
VPQVLAEFDRDQVAGAFRSLHGMRDEQALHALQAKCELTLKKVLETIRPASTVRPSLRSGSGTRFSRSRRLSRKESPDSCPLPRSGFFPSRSPRMP